MFQLGTPTPTVTPVPGVLIPLTVVNELEGTAWGLELASEWEVSSGWRLRGSYSYFDADLRADVASDGRDAREGEGTSPQHQVTLRSAFDVTDEIEFDTTLRAVDDLANSDVSGYVELDLRLAWQPMDNVELSVVGRNLLQSAHEEFQSEILDLLPTQVERSVYGKVSIKF